MEGDNGGQQTTTFRDVTYPRRELAPEAEQYWTPFAGPPPQREEQVDVGIG